MGDGEFATHEIMKIPPWPPFCKGGLGGECAGSEDLVLDSGVQVLAICLEIYRYGIKYPVTDIS
jgi:hypothetical protein